METLRKRFKYCDSRFDPYLNKVLERLPEEVKDRVLNNDTLQIISTENEFGIYSQLDPPIEHLIWLNSNVLNKADFQIIHTVAHEIAHWIVGPGETRLYEKEAEDLLVKWGFGEEVELVQYYRPICESEGYKIGYEWAEKHEDYLYEFEEYYDEWNEGKLTPTSYKMLHYDADVTSILDEMGALEESDNIDDNQEMIADDQVLDKGIIWGIMNYLKDKKRKERSRYQEMNREKADFLELLERVRNDLSKMLMLSPYARYRKGTNTTKSCDHCGKDVGVFLGDFYQVVCDTLETLVMEFEKSQK